MVFLQNLTNNLGTFDTGEFDIEPVNIVFESFVINTE